MVAMAVVGGVEALLLALPMAAAAADARGGPPTALRRALVVAEVRGKPLDMAEGEEEEEEEGEEEGEEAWANKCWAPAPTPPLSSSPRGVCQYAAA